MSAPLPQRHAAAAHEDQPWASAYRIFLADADGHLKVLHTLPHPPPAPQPDAAAAHDAPAEPVAAAGEQQAEEEEEGEDVPRLPCLQLLPIEHRAPISPPSFSSSTAGTPDAVQRMAGGWVHSGHGHGGAAAVWVLALARRGGSVDVVLPLPQPQPLPRRAGGYAPQRAVLVGTLQEENMRVGMERWAGLRVGSRGIYSCTSAGALRFTPVLPSADGPHALRLAEPSTLQLPHAPLTHVLFASFSSGAGDPTHVLVGGLDVPLSVWALGAAFASAAGRGPLAQEAAVVNRVQAENGAGEAEEEEEEEDVSALSAKQRKRKRQVEARNKAKELREGEVWRAKALPNDALSLQQKPLIAAIAILHPGQPATAAAADPSALPPGLRIGTATKTGLLRVYAPEPGSHGGKAVAEFACLGGKGAEGRRKEEKGVKGTMAIGLVKKGVASGGAEVKLVHGGAGASDLFVADTQGKLYALDTKTQRVLYQYPNIDGAITSLTTLTGPGPRAPSSTQPQTYLLSTSLDRILRLHSTATSTSDDDAAPRHGKANVGRARGRVLVEVFAGALYGAGEEMAGTLPAAPVAAVWDGEVPLPLVAAGATEEEKAEAEGESEDEDVWDEMDQVGEEERGAEGGDAQEEDEEVAAARRGAATKKKRPA